MAARLHICGLYITPEHMGGGETTDPGLQGGRFGDCEEVVKSSDSTRGL